jgi:hypothetical protein
MATDDLSNAHAASGVPVTALVLVRQRPRRT